MSSRPEARLDVDVAVIGSRLAPNLLAAILARQGLRVALVEPRGYEAVPGDTTIPYTAELFLLLASRFDVPEIADLAKFEHLPERLRRTCGVKRSLTFLYHRAGHKQDPRESVQFQVPREHSEWHLHQPSLDQYTRELAVRYGAICVDGSPEAGLVIDATAQTPAAHMPRQRSRLVSAQLLGVEPFEAQVPLRRYRRALPFAEGTLTHAFDGGWMQLVPLDNHPEAATGASAVTLSLDLDRREPRGTPAADVAAVLAELPDVQRQLAKAQPLEGWRAVEPFADGRHDPRRLCLGRPAAGSDVLLSSALTLELELVHAAATQILGAADAGRVDAGALQPVHRLQRELLAFHERLSFAAASATCAFPLWNAFLRVWLLWTITSTLSLMRARLDAQASRDWSALEAFDRGPFWVPVPEPLPELVDELLSTVASARQGRAPDGVAKSVFTRLREEPIVPPLYRFWDPRARVYRFTAARRLRMRVWARTQAPEDFRRLLVAGGP